jgi:hypothetical protein
MSYITSVNKETTPFKSIVLDNEKDWLAYIKVLAGDASNKERKKQSKVVYDYYNGNQRGYLYAEYIKIFTDAFSRESKRKWVHNITSQIVDARAIVYSHDIKRTLLSKNKKALLSQYNSILWGDHADSTMSEAEHLIEYDRQCLTYVRWDDKKQRVVYTNYHQWQYDLVFQEDSDDLRAVIISDYGKEHKDTNYMIITQDTNYKFQGDILLNKIVHNLGFLPCRLLYAKDPGFERYLTPDVNLAQNNLELNLAYSNLLNILMCKAHGLTVITIPADSPIPREDDSNPNIPTGNTNIEQDSRLGLHDPNQILILRNGADGQASTIQNIGAQVQFDKAIETINFILSSMAESYGVKLGETKIYSGSQPQTATQIFITDKTKQKIMKVKEYLFREFEKEIFYVGQTLANKAIKMKISSIDDLKIEYLPQSKLLTDINVDQVIKLAGGEKIYTRVAAVATLHNGMSLEDAQVFIEEMDRIDSEYLAKTEQTTTNDNTKSSANRELDKKDGTISTNDLNKKSYETGSINQQ